MKHKDEQILRLHVTSNGAIWCAQGIQTPELVTQAMDEYVASLSTRSSLYVRLYGTAINAPLLVQLYTRCKSAVIEVASPDICEDEAERNDPVVAMHRMRQCLRPPSLGGWHRYTASDHASYQLVLQTQDNDNRQMVFDTHPAAYDLSFIPTLDRSAAAELLRMIIDPRWFVSLKHPERLSRLRLFLGLTPLHVSQVMNDDLRSEKTKRCAVVLRAWGFNNLRPPDSERCADPRQFLWRRYARAGGGVKGGLRASTAFITYCVRAWEQQRLRRDRSNVEIFVPSYLLQDDEAEAYRQHDAERV